MAKNATDRSAAWLADLLEEHQPSAAFVLGQQSGVCLAEGRSPACAHSLTASTANLLVQRADNWSVPNCCYCGSRGNGPHLERFAAMLPVPPEKLRLDTLRTFVQQAICEHNDLEANASPISERVLLRGGEIWGIFFCVQGPRNVKFTAIWDQEKNMVLFYDSAGERQHRTPFPCPG